MVWVSIIVCLLNWLYYFPHQQSSWILRQALKEYQRSWEKAITVETYVCYLVQKESKSFLITFMNVLFKTKYIVKMEFNVLQWLQLSKESQVDTLNTTLVYILSTFISLHSFIYQFLFLSHLQVASLRISQMWTYPKLRYIDECIVFNKTIFSNTFLIWVILYHFNFCNICIKFWSNLHYPKRHTCGFRIKHKVIYIINADF